MEFLLVLGIFGIAFLLLSVGIIFSKKEIHAGTCGSDLIVNGDGASCSTSSTLWDCEISSASASELHLSFYPVGGVVPVAKGETLYFYLNNNRAASFSFVVSYSDTQK